jgi:hypothetical protein
MFNNPSEGNPNFEMYGFQGSTEIGLMAREEVHEERNSQHNTPNMRQQRSSGDSTLARMRDLLKNCQFVLLALSISCLYFVVCGL